MKNLVFIVLAVLSAPCIGETWTDPDTGLVWVYSDGELGIIIGEEGTCVSPSDMETLEIPEKIAGRKVWSVSEKAFDGMDRLRFLRIRSDVGICDALDKCPLLERIDAVGPLTDMATEDGVLYRRGTYAELRGGVLCLGTNDVKWLERVPCNYQAREFTVPDSVTGISEGAFSDCGNFERIILPEGLKSIREDAFRRCKALKEIKIPPLVKSIPDGAFAFCTALSDIDFGNGVEEIGKWAFSGCSNLVSVYIPASVSSPGAFGGCDSLERIEVSPENKDYCGIEGVLYRLDTRSKLTEALVRVPPKCGIKRLELPDGVVASSDYDTFAGVSGVETLVLPSSFRYFENMGTLSKDLRYFEVKEGNNMYEAHDGVLYRYGLESLARCPPGYDKLEFAVPAETKKICSSSFNGCKGIRRVRLGESVEAIGEAAFSESGIEEFAWPVKIKTISRWTFMQCENLRKVTLPSTLEAVGAMAFSLCPNIEEFAIAGEGGSFYIEGGCLCHGGPNASARLLVRVTKSAIKDGTLVVPPSVTQIGSEACDGVPDLKTVVVPESVRCIMPGAFYKCDNLTAVVFLSRPPTIYYSGRVTVPAKAELYVDASDPKWGLMLHAMCKGNPVKCSDKASLESFLRGKGK